MCRFSMRKSYWLCLSTLALLMATSGARAQIPISVDASASSLAPAWCPAPTDESNPAQASLGASVDAPTAPYGCTLEGPFWEWGIDPNSVQYSPDNSMWSQAPYDSFSAWIVPNPGGATATLYVIYYIGGYWQFPCAIGVSFDDYTSGCGDSWFGTSTCLAVGTSVRLLSLTVSGATQVVDSTDAWWQTSWAAVKKTGDTVIITATTMPNNADGWAQIQWTGGNAGASANQRTVDKGTSAKTSVIGQTGNRYQEGVNIWILWVTITNQIDGTTPPNAVQFGTSYDGTENLGAVMYNGGTVARGKIIPIGKITPAGVHNVVKLGWEFKRDRMSRVFEDGAQDPNWFNNDWKDDTSDASFQVLTPDASDQIYDRDAPNITGFYNATDSAEAYHNFREYVLWNGTMASDYQDWYWRGRWKVDQNPQVTLMEIGQGSIALPNAAFYPPP